MGSLYPAITNVSTGQIYNKSNSRLFWGILHSDLKMYRDDVIAYDYRSNDVVFSGAVWDGKSLTYWWGHTVP